MKNSNEVLRKFISTLFSFFLFLAITLVFSIIAIYFGLFNDQHFLDKMDESNYYNEIYEEVTINISEILSSAKIPKTVGKKVFTLKRVYIDGKNYVEQTISGKDYTIDNVKLRDNLKKSIYNYLDNKNIKLTEELKVSIDEMIELSLKEYQRIVSFKLVDYYTEYKAQFAKVANILLGIAVIIACVICTLLMFLRKKRYQGIRYILYAILGASFMNLLPASYLLLSETYKNVEAEPEFYKYFLVSHLRTDISMFLYVGVLGLVFSGILFLLIKYLKENK